MAAILSPVWSIIRRSIAGTTYTANTYHAIVARQRVAPVQPNTLYQTLIRSSMSQAASNWKTASQAERDMWYAYSLTVTYQGPLGPYAPGARQLFMAQFALRAYLQKRGLSVIEPRNYAPVTPGRLPGTVSVGEYVAPPGTGIVVGIDSPGPEGTTWHSNISIAHDATRNFWKGPYIVRDAQTASVDVPSAVVIPFTGLIAGRIYFTRTIGVTNPDGLATPPVGCRVSQVHFLRHVAQTVLP